MTLALAAFLIAVIFSGTVIMDQCCTCNLGCTTGAWYFSVCAQYNYPPMQGFFGTGHYSVYTATSSCGGYSSAVQESWDPLAGLWFETENTSSGDPSDCGCAEGDSPDGCTIVSASNTEVVISYQCKRPDGSVYTFGTYTYTVSGNDEGGHYGFAPLPGSATALLNMLTKPNAPGCGGNCDPEDNYPNGFLAGGDGIIDLSCCDSAAVALTWVSTGYNAGYWEIGGVCEENCSTYFAGSLKDLTDATFTAPNTASCAGDYPVVGIVGNGGPCCQPPHSGCFANDPDGGCGVGGYYTQSVGAVFGSAANSACVITYSSCGADPVCATGQNVNGQFFNPPDGTGVDIYTAECGDAAGLSKPSCCE